MRRMITNFVPKINPARSEVVRIGWLTFFCSLFLLFISGCDLDRILEVELPTKVEADQLEDPAMAGTLVNSALGDFECAFTNYVAATGLIAGEMRHSTGWYAYTPWDHRTISRTEDTRPCDVNLGYGLYRPMQTARVQAKQASELIEGYPDDAVPDKQSLIATVQAYEAYALTILGEGWCEMAIDLSPILTPEEVLSRAETRFQDAIQNAEAAGNGEIRNTALVGLARVSLNLGKTQQALQAAELVSEGFERLITRGTSEKRRWNLLYHDNIANRFISVHPDFADLEWAGVPDSRVEVVPGGTGHDQTEILVQTKYSGVSSPLVLASWEEAQLIIAEIKGGQEAVSIINRFHERAGLPPFASDDPDEILEHVLQERARALFLEGHHFNDKLRHDLPFNTGLNPWDGVPYGDTTCMPLIQMELDGNPNIGS